MAQSEPVLTIEGLNVEYRTSRGPLRAVRDASFAVGAAEAVALIGESGSGKSTVAQATLGLLARNARVTSGSVRYSEPGGGASELLGLSERQLRKFRWSRCALVPQGAINSLNPVMRISEHFDDTARAHEYLRGRALRERAHQLLSSVRLDAERAWRAYPHELSGGMRQRVLIALAMLLQPRLLILDEPTTALDLLTQRSILDVLRELRTSSQFSVLFISHDLPVAAEIADRVVTMYAGRVIEIGPTSLATSRPRHPYTLGLLRAVPHLGGSLDDVRPVPGSPPDLVELPQGCPFAPRCFLSTDVCRAIDPPLERVVPEQAAACHHWSDVPAVSEPKVAASA